MIEAVGGGNRTHANIAAEAGSRSKVVPSGTLTPVLRRLVEDKHVPAIDEPLSVRPTKPALYRVADSSLRFYLAIGRAAHELSRRGRATAAGTLSYVGSVKWLDHPFGSRDLAALQRSAPLVPGFDPGETVLVGVSCTGFTDSAAANLALGWLPGDIIRASA